MSINIKDAHTKLIKAIPINPTDLDDCRSSGALDSFLIVADKAVIREMIGHGSAIK
jgi:hypothetical protein